MSQGSPEGKSSAQPLPRSSGVHLLCTRESPYANETGRKPWALANGFLETGSVTLNKLATCKVLVIGAGGRVRAAQGSLAVGV